MCECWKKICEQWKNNKISVIISIVFLLLFSYVFYRLLFFCFCPQTTLQPIRIREDHIKEAQKEMENLSQFLMSNAQIIIWIRGILLTIWIGIISYILKEYYMGDGYSKSVVDQKKNLIRILLFVILLFAFILEFPIQTAQASLTNRVSQLDEAINEKILQTCPNQLQEIFVYKNRVNPSPHSLCDFIVMVWNVIRAPTFFLFYGSLLLFLIIFPCFLNDQKETEQKFSKTCGE